MSTLLLTNMENTYGVILSLSLYPNPNKLHATLFLKYKISKEKLFSLSASYCRSTTLSDTRRRIYIEQKIWGCLLRWFKKCLNNITRIFIHFYGHTYIQKMQTKYHRHITKRPLVCRQGNSLSMQESHVSSWYCIQGDVISKSRCLTNWLETTQNPILIFGCIN